MADSETLKQILEQLKQINKTLQNFKGSFESHHELLMNKLTVIESISGNARDFLKEVSKNIKQ